MSANVKPAILIPLLFAISFIYFLFNLDAIWSTSIDFADHYGLTDSIVSSLDFSLSNGEHLGIMHKYPKLAHTIAALVSLIFGSTVLGIQTVSFFSICAIWIAISLLIAWNKKESVVFVFIFYSLFVLLNKYFGGLNIWGEEIVENFFFSQLVGTALCLLTIAFAIYLSDKKASELVITIFVFISTIALIQTHLLPAVQLYLAYIIYSFFNFVSNSHSQSKRANIVFLSILTSILLMGFFVFESSKVIVDISKHNGELKTLFTVPTLAFWGFVLILISSWLAFYHHKFNISALNWISSLGIAIGILVVLQFFAFKLGFGSEYAVKKYVFGMFSLLSLNTITLISIFFSKNSYLSAYLFPKSNWQLYPAIVLFFSTTLFCLTNRPPVASTSSIKYLENTITTINASFIEKTKNKNLLVSGIQNSNVIIDYMFTMKLGSNRDFAINHAINNISIIDYSMVSGIITSLNSSLYLPKCAMAFPSGSLRVINPNCISSEENNIRSCSGIKSFGYPAYTSQLTLRGFSHAEREWTWSNGNHATFSCFPVNKFQYIKICGFAYLPKGVPQQRIIISIGDSTHNFNVSSSNSCFKLPILGLLLDRPFNVNFTFLDSISPRDANESGDIRQLAFALKSIEFID